MKTAQKSSQDPYKVIFETSNDAIQLLDKEKGYFDCNEATLRVFRCKTKAEFCGNTSGEWSPPKQPNGANSIKLAKERIEKALKTGKNSFEWIHRRADGEDFPTEVLLTPLIVDGKKVLQATVRDISDRKRQEDEHVFLASIIENADDAILSKSLDEVILSWNHGAELLYGWTAKEVIGKPIKIIFPQDHEDEMKGISGRIKKGEKIGSFETVRLRKDGRRVDVSMTVSPVKNSDGKIIGAAAIARDITKQKEKAAELEKMNKLMIGRELKMVELKQKISQLEKHREEGE